MNLIAGHDPEIRPVSSQGHAEAFSLVFGRLEAEPRRQQVETLLTGIAGGKVSPQGLLGAYRGGRLVGAVFSQVEPGRTAMVWTPRVTADESAATAGRLLDAASDWLRRHRVRIAQIQCRLDHQTDEALLREHGYQPLADLLYLVSLEDEFPAGLPKGPLEFEPYSVVNHKRLAEIVEATYRQTLDCPQLDGVREIEDVLAGYRATGVFDPSRWLIVRHQGQDVGCLLLADHPEDENWELVYMGVAGSRRGHGWGMDIARHAQWRTRRAGRPRLVLAVDAANEPAIRAYAAVGFKAWQRRSVFLRIFHDAD